MTDAVSLNVSVDENHRMAPKTIHRFNNIIMLYVCKQKDI